MNSRSTPRAAGHLRGGPAPWPPRPYRLRSCTSPHSLRSHDGPSVSRPPDLVTTLVRGPPYRLVDVIHVRRPVACAHRPGGVWSGPPRLPDHTRVLASAASKVRDACGQRNSCDLWVTSPTHPRWRHGGLVQAEASGSRLAGCTRASERLAVRLRMCPGSPPCLRVHVSRETAHNPRRRVLRPAHMRQLTTQAPSRLPSPHPAGLPPYSSSSAARASDVSRGTSPRPASGLSGVCPGRDALRVGLSLRETRGSFAGC